MNGISDLVISYGKSDLKISYGINDHDILFGINDLDIEYREFTRTILVEMKWTQYHWRSENELVLII